MQKTYGESSFPPSLSLLAMGPEAYGLITFFQTSETLFSHLNNGNHNIWHTNHTGLYKERMLPVNYKHCINIRCCRVTGARIEASINLRSPSLQYELSDTGSVSCPFLSYITWNIVSIYVFLHWGDKLMYESKVLSLSLPLIQVGAKCWRRCLK